MALALATQSGGVLKTEYGFATGFRPRQEGVPVLEPPLSGPEEEQAAASEPRVAPAPPPGETVASQSPPQAPFPDSAADFAGEEQSGEPAQVEPEDGGQHEVEAGPVELATPPSREPEDLAESRASRPQSRSKPRRTRRVWPSLPSRPKPISRSRPILSSLPRPHRRALRTWRQPQAGWPQSRSKPRRSFPTSRQSKPRRASPSPVSGPCPISRSRPTRSSMSVQLRLSPKKPERDWAGNRRCRHSIGRARCCYRPDHPPRSRACSRAGTRSAAAIAGCRSGRRARHGSPHSRDFNRRTWCGRGHRAGRARSRRTART